RQDVTALLDRIANRGSPVQANRTLARLKTLFKWVLDEELIPADPTARVRKVVKETARDRTLTDDEIRLFWAGCDKLGWPFGPMYKLLLLTAQRRDEVGCVEWSEIDIDRRQWAIPREKAKNDRAHEVHLSWLAIEVLDRLPKIGDRYVLAASGPHPLARAGVRGGRLLARCRSRGRGAPAPGRGSPPRGARPPRKANK